MKTENTKIPFTKGQKIGLTIMGIITIIPLIALIQAFGSMFAPMAQAKMDLNLLQKSVEMAQADYDLSQSQAKDAAVAYCKSWKELAESKIALGEATGLMTQSQKNARTNMVDVDCSTAANLLPSAF